MKLHFLRKKILQSHKHGNITYVDSLLARVFKDCEIAGMFEKVGICILKYVNLARLFTAPGLVLQTALKKNESKLDLLNAIIMLLMVETSITGGTCHAIY